MSKRRLTNCYDYLSVLSKSGPKARRAILEEANTDLVRTICECALNVLHANVKINKRDKKRLNRHRKLLRKLSSNSYPIRKKKNAIVQSGGSFLLALLPALISTIAALVGQ